MNITRRTDDSHMNHFVDLDLQSKIDHETEERRELVREYPPVSFVDTVRLVNGIWESEHGKVKFFKDSQILTIHPGQRINPATVVKAVVEFEVRRNNLGKHVLQQQATRGCTAGVVAMLFLDHHLGIDVCELQDTNLGNNKSMQKSLQTGGLIPIVSSMPNSHRNPLGWLKSKIDEGGAAIVSIDEGGHVIIVDQISDQGIRLRDPYHGWDITVTVEAFKKNWCPREAIIQIRS